MLFTMGFSGGVLILLIVILRAFAIHKIPKKVFILLWDIVLLRLLVPVNLPFSYGIASPAVSALKTAADSGFCKADRGELLSLPEAGRNISQSRGKDWILEVPEAGLLNHMDWLAVIWLAGTVILSAVFLSMYVRESRRMKEALPLPKEMEEKLRQMSNIPDFVKLLISDRISSPLAVGILSPKIILPKSVNTTDARQLNYVLTHEMIHVKRADNFRKIVLLPAVCIHWFHPMVWVMYALYHRDLELSCDEKVIALFGEQAKKEYAAALVQYAEKQCRPMLFSNGFGKNPVQERIEAIMKFKKATVVTIVCAVLLAGAALTVFAEGSPSNSAARNLAAGSPQEDVYPLITYAKVDENGNITEKVERDYFNENFNAYGLECRLPGCNLYYKGRLVKYFFDNPYDNDSEVSSICVQCPEGETAVKVIRDYEKQISDLKEMTREEIESFEKKVKFTTSNTDN